MGQKAAVKGQVFKINMETVVAQGFSSKFTLPIQKLPEVSVIHSAMS